MADKKNGSLAKKLIDDLLEEDLGHSEVEIDSPEHQEPLTEVPPFPEGVSLSAVRPIEDDKTLPLTPELEDSTLQLPEPTRSEILQTDHTRVKRSKNTSDVSDEVRAGVGRFAPLRSGAMTSADASLAQAENLRIAQSRILELENEMERLRSSNEQLAAAGETLRKRADENMAMAEAAKTRYQTLESTAGDERHFLQTNIQAKDKELQTLRTKVDEMEMRLSSNIQKIRVRERELENRLELIKMESQALLRSKDEMILDLKRKSDQTSIELDNYRSKGQELNKQIQEKQDLLRRTVKALRLALSMLEGDEETQRQKKVK